MATAAVIAASIALVPGPASAAAHPHTATTPHTATPPPLDGAGSAAFRTFTSPADKSYRVQKPATTSSTHSLSTGKTIYAITETCTTDTGTGTQSAPFCDLQDAVNAAAPGDTIMVSATVNANSQNSYSTESVTVKTSGISIIGTTNHPTVEAGTTVAGKPALILDGVSNVTISHLGLQSYSAPMAVEIIGSSQIALDSDQISANYGSGIAIDGASSGIAVTRTYVNPSYPSSLNPAITVASGASTITVAGDLFAASGIIATGVNGLNVTGNTIQRGCHSAVDIEGVSSAVAIENNLLEDGNQNTDLMVGGYKSQCSNAGAGWAPDVTVSAGSSAATTADFNDFYIDGSNATVPYNWAGTAYPTLATFQAAQTQAAHDTIDTVKALPVGNGQEGGVDYALQPGSAAINSANPNAFGALSSDYFGGSPLTDRGAVKYLSTNPGMALALTAKNTSAYGISLTANVTSKPVEQDLYIYWGDGSPTGVQIFYGNAPMTVTLPHTYPKLGTYTITAAVSDRSGNTVANSVQVSMVGSEYTAYGPKRLLDTRDGTGAPKAKVQPYGAARVQIVGNGGIPTGVTAAVLNVTVTDTAAGGHITAYGEGGRLPTTSNVNYAAGQTVPNLVTVPVGSDGYVDLYNGGWGPVDLVADITGYFTQSPSSGYIPVAPTRLIDTRDGTGTAKGQIGAYASFPVQISGAAPGLPGGITAVALNVTATRPRSGGHLTVYPDGGSTPTTSAVNFTAGQTVANAVIVPVGSDGKIRVLNGAWMPTDVVVDVVGFYSTSNRGAFMPIAPERLLDTRDASWKYGPLTGRGYIDMPITQRFDLTAFVLNTTVTDTTDQGHLTVSPDPNSLAAYQGGTAIWPTPPNVSTLNWLRGQTVPNLVQATPGGGGIIDYWNMSDGKLDLIVDAFGYYQND
ncbi:hypothetical protein ABIA33_003748 [Streptacidiphilus sp. MAP12-16]|uniref:hypothetical protein n=1 Tax=Streptacidiphilus sp. MAP12-16 TaxID=3156300 RepID=UPI0035131597